MQVQNKRRYPALSYVLALKVWIYLELVNSCTVLNVSTRNSPDSTLLSTSHPSLRKELWEAVMCHHLTRIRNDVLMAQLPPLNLQWTKDALVQWLGKMCRVWRECQQNHLMLGSIMDGTGDPTTDIWALFPAPTGSLSPHIKLVSEA